MYPTAAMILTMYVNRDPVRRAMYRRNIHAWIQRTQLPLFVVESSAEPIFYLHPRITWVTFQQEEKADYQPTSTVREAQALQYVWREQGSVLREFHWVFKCTAKYFLPAFTLHLRQIPKEKDIIFQHRHDDSIRWQQSELFGMTPHYWEFFLRHYDAPDYQSTVMERRLHGMDVDYCVAKSPGLPVPGMLWPLSFLPSIYRLPELAVLYRTPRASGDTLPSL